MNVKEGDVIEMMNGVSTLSLPHPQALLRNQVGRHILLRVKSLGDGKPCEVVVKPLSGEEESDLRYSEWEYIRRLRVDEIGKGELGYVHLRAMSKNDSAAGHLGEQARRFRLVDETSRRGEQLKLAKVGAGIYAK